MKDFKPLLAPNKQPDINTLSYPLLASYKIDGIRCIFKEGKLLTRALKYFPNEQITKRFIDISEYAKNYNCILDGELYSPSLSFTELSGLCRNLNKKLPEDLTFNCFDIIENLLYDTPFNSRISYLESLIKLPYFIVVNHWSVFNAKETQILFQNALAHGFEGLILRNPKGCYKFGRATLNENIIYKLKPFETFDAQIIDVLQGTIVDPKAEKTITELGYSRTSKLKENRLPSGRASDFVVKYNGKDLKVSIAATNNQKRDFWEYRETYIGKWIEYKGMLVGAKDLPRHPTFIRFREDRE